jgi:catechol 2,3-dioxygenase-like lactoylglutathione lyase family enzyme
MIPIIDHIHITINNIDEAEKYYDKLLSIIGFDMKNKETTIVEKHRYKLIEYNSKYFSFGIVSPRNEFIGIKINRRRPGTIHHLAFMVENKETVDKIFVKIKEIGSIIISEPKYYEEYCSDYYAFFFKDNQNIEYEIVNFNREKYFEE